MIRLGLRMRLTLLNGVLFFLAGSALLWVIYLLVARALTQKFVTKFTAVGITDQLSQVKGQDMMFADTVIQQRADEVLAEVLRWSIGVMVLIGIVALAVGYLVADRALKPLDRMTETARRLSESTLHERISLKGPQDEVKRLADTFDGMLDRLHKVFDTQRRFIANASHELRTPLAVNRTVLEVSLEEPAASEDLKAMARALLGTNARYERLIEGLLLLAQSEQELATREPVRVERVVRTALDLTPPAKRRVSVHRDLQPAVVEGDPLFLERCVFNLVENALKFNVRDGDVWVTLRDDDTEVSVTVENTGPVVSPFEVEELFRPFHSDRIHSGRGAGLGLSIVRAIADAHGGSVTAVARPEGGLRVVLRLPSVTSPR
ncbi:ATP-binding protein [Nonomuraea sp. NBC_01738]|uniref:sensor histidine kinase n=1 Tax=Nonomuraea sp. NBC_01738 TaxID=2976003 RepID=UPI002E0F377D|nr:ATP-binding protein [Nonomuraea sp. NBC_01738]